MFGALRTRRSTVSKRFKMIQFKTLKHKLLTAFLVFGLVPLGVVGYLAYQQADGSLEATIGENLSLQAQTAIDAIDRNLFERYGDVQAFAANPMARGGRREVEEIADFLTKNYGIYDLMLIVDLDGKIVAANTVDYKGNKANTSALVGQSVKGEAWFDDVSSGKIGPGETFYSDLAVDPMTARVTGERGLALNFSAPIYDESGKIVRVWSNRASWTRIASEIMTERAALLKSQGAETIEYQVLNSAGFVIDDYDPDAILNFDLAGAGLGAANKAINGQLGYTIEIHKRRQVAQINGYAASKGALGFKGYGWGALVRQDRAEAAGDAADIRNFVIMIGLAAALLIAVLALWIAGGISGPVAETADALDGVAEGDYSRRLESKSTDEVGRLADSVNRMTERVKDAMEQVQTASEREKEQGEATQQKVAEMLSALEAVGAGDYSKTLSVRGSDPIGRLGEGLSNFFAEKQASETREREKAEVERQQQQELREKVDSMLASVTTAAGGDLTVDVQVKGDDAPGRMAQGLRTFFDRLRETISGLTVSSRQLSTSADELSEGSLQMTEVADKTSTQAGVVSAASDEVSSNVQVAAAGVEEMSASISEIAKSSSDAASIASEAVGVAESANSTIKGLGDASVEIGNVVKVITSIAEQTNLLALNATIEAARAGEAGKGFAVVANEVKELAKQTAQATEDISQKIGAIQSGSTAAVDAIGEVGTIINRINDISTTIASAVEEQTATTNEISRNVSDAARGSSEITQNITGVATNADSTSRGANAALESAKSLADMSAQLQQVVGRFRV